MTKWISIYQILINILLLQRILKNMNVEEELINKIMMRMQKYVSDDDLPNVKDDIICCVYGYEISEKQKYEVI